MRFAWIAAALAGFAAPAVAQPARIALVLGNATYAEGGMIEPVPACAGSAAEVAGALRRLGFRVTERLNASRGATEVALSTFARDLREAPGAVGVAYACGQMAHLGDRVFFLPSSAAIERETDVVSQGVLVRQIQELMIRAQAATGLVVLDGFVASRPAAAPLAASLAPLGNAAAAGGIGFAASLAAPRAGTTPLAAALVAELAGPEVALAEVLADLRGRLPPGSLVAHGVPASPGMLVAAAPPAPAPVEAPAPAAQAAPPQAAQAARQAAPPPAPAAAPAAPRMPAEAAMTEAERRRVQAALARLGYYAGQADGVFGPNTRAAIRRFQHEIGAELTGTLTAAQASRLLAP